MKKHVSYFRVLFAALVSWHAAFVVGVARAQTTKGDVVDVVVRDDNPKIDCDALHLQIPNGWGVRGRIAWGLTALSPVRQIVSASNPNGAELWVLYPGESFVWRDSFDLFGIPVRPNAGDADLATGEEIERPPGAAADIIKQVLVARFRPDLAQATIVSIREYSEAQSLELAKSLTPATAQGGDPRIHFTHRAAVARFDYARDGKALQEDLMCLALYADIPSAAQGTMHLWQIEYATSFRAEKGRLDDEKSSVGAAIQSSLKIDPQWQKKAVSLQQAIAQVYAQRLHDLAAARMSDIRAQASRAIFQMSQQSYRHRTQMQARQVHDMSNAIRGTTDYLTPNGQTIEAPLTPFGRNAWRGPDGEVHFVKAGTSPGAGYESLSPQ